jgi:hypothetical protein
MLLQTGGTLVVVVPLANSTLIIFIFRNVEIFQILFLPNQKNIVKDNSENLGIFHLLK